MQIDSVPEVATQLWLGVHKDDVPACELRGSVPLLILPANKNQYIGFHEDKKEAVNRAVQVCGEKCEMSKDTMVLHSVKFSNKSFVKNATTALGADEEFASMIHNKRRQTPAKTGVSGPSMEISLFETMEMDKF